MRHVMRIQRLLLLLTRPMSSAPEMGLPHQLTANRPEGKTTAHSRTKSPSAVPCASHSDTHALRISSTVQWQVFKHLTRPVFSEDVSPAPGLLCTLGDHAAKRSRALSILMLHLCLGKPTPEPPHSHILPRGSQLSQSPSSTSVLLWMSLTTLPACFLQPGNPRGLV